MLRYVFLDESGQVIADRDFPDDPPWVEDGKPTSHYRNDYGEAFRLAGIQDGCAFYRFVGTEEDDG